MLALVLLNVFSHVPRLRFSLSKYLFANKVKELQKERKNKPTNYIEVTVTN